MTIHRYASEPSARTRRGVSHGAMPTLPPGARSRDLPLARRASSASADGCWHDTSCRLHHGVWVHRDQELTETIGCWRHSLALPDRAHLTGITLIQQLGLDFGPRDPIRFVDQVTSTSPLTAYSSSAPSGSPLTDVGVTPAAAFIAYCARARVIDAIKVGDWLLHDGHMPIAEVRALALRELWRRAPRGDLDPRAPEREARSLPESEVRASWSFAGLARPS